MRLVTGVRYLRRSGALVEFFRDVAAEKSKCV